MKKLAFVIGGAALMALSACSGNNDDAVNNAELNQPAAEDLNVLANAAATNAEDAALGNQQQQLEDENASATVNTTANTTESTDADEQNVSGM
ncbi:MAG TPA: hypothetical protein VIL42_01765 [Sphingomicrobium sp.]|jgi:heat shock protein HslJ